MKFSAKFIVAVSLALFFCVAGHARRTSKAPMAVIFDTDLGNDTDDVIAMDILYKYANEGKISILAEGINKEGLGPAEYMDILNQWYGHPDIPFGIIHNGAKCGGANNYATTVNALTDANGKPLFARTPGMDYASLPESHLLYRKILAGCKNKSVTFVAVGFSTNLARLLDTPADEYSPLTGSELVATKVKNLVMMAGSFNGARSREFNVRYDIRAAQKVVTEWPTPVVFVPFELGSQVRYPSTSIENDFNWVDHHPMVEADIVYKPMPHDRPCWDPAALVYAVEGDKWFGVSSPGFISISDKGTTTFKASKKGKHTYLTVTPEQASALKDRIVEIVTRRR